MQRLRKESMNLKIGEFKLFILRSRKKKRMKKNEPSLRDLWDPIQPNKIYITNHRRKGEREKSRKNIWEIIVENLSSFIKVINLYIQKGQQIPRTINAKRTTCIYNVVKVLKYKNRCTWSSKRKTHHMQRDSNKINY